MHSTHTHPKKEKKRLEKKRDVLAAADPAARVVLTYSGRGGGGACRHGAARCESSAENITSTPMIATRSNLWLCQIID